MMRLFFLILIWVCFTGCRKDELVIPAEYDVIPETPASDSQVQGFYIVNEGNMGSNKCTLDYFDYFTGLYARNFYAERNPNVIKELGDVGNDIGIYGSKLYVVVNCSHKVEVMDARSGLRIGQVDIPNCRYIRFSRGRAYVTSYVGAISIGSDAPKGAVYEVDTTLLKVMNKVTVGYQPEEFEIIDNHMYVANSGGYRAPDFDSTISVVRLPDLKQIQQIPVGINLHRIKKDNQGKLWVASRGDKLKRRSQLYVLDRNAISGEMELTDTLDYACSNMAVYGNNLYFYATEWDNATQSNKITYGIIDTGTKELISTNFITDGTDKGISIPYGIAIHPETGDILLTDAKNYVSSGTLYCFNPSGKLRWKIRTGDIPAHIAFLKKYAQTQE